MAKIAYLKIGIICIKGIVCYTSEYITKGRPMTSGTNKKVKMTVLLDDESLKNLRQYGVDVANTGSISKIIRVMANNYGNQKNNNNKQ